MSKERRIGLLGGSFDPVHYGHLVMAENAREQLDLDLVVLAPAGQPPHKVGRRIASAEDRLAMLDLAIAGGTRFVSSRIDMEHEGPSFTWLLLERFHEAYPGSKLSFIMGSDSLRDFEQWRAPERILELARIAVIRRPGFGLVDKEWDDVPGLRNHVDIVDAPLCEVSSTEIRGRVGRGATIRYLVPEPVREYIEEMGLYR